MESANGGMGQWSERLSIKALPLHLPGVRATAPPEAAWRRHATTSGTVLTNLWVAV